ncbi:glycosyltransferase family 2 protein [candidate division WOR-3 bacterium]|nr:glycosyltransferase family 2 protein [candidate division WOR-3 bacterium]
MKTFKRNNLSLISIIIPCRNEEKFISKCLNSIIANDYPRDKLEILVVDGMSTDKTREIILDFAQKHSNIKVLDNPKKITSTGLNIGIKNAKGDIIIIIGTHTCIMPNFLKKSIETLSRVNADCVGGTIESIQEGFMPSAIAYGMSCPFGIGNAAFRYSKKEGWVDTVAFGAYPKKVFDKIGLFDKELVRCQDDEFNYRLRKARGKIFLNPEIKSYYYPRSSLKKLWHQYFQYGFWKVRVFQKHPKMMQIRQFVPGAFVFVVGLSFIIGIFYTPFLWMFGSIVLCYLMSSLFFSSIVAKQHSWKYFLVMPAIFSTLHIGYGTGFLTGLVRFINRWKKCKA